MSDKNDVPNAPLVIICSDSLPSKSLFWLVKSTIANLTISPIYMPLIIFSNLQHDGKRKFQTPVRKSIYLTSVLQDSTSLRRSPGRILYGWHLTFHRPRTRPTRCLRLRAILSCRRRKVQHSPHFQRNMRYSPFLHKHMCYDNSTRVGTLRHPPLPLTVQLMLHNVVGTLL